MQQPGERASQVGPATADRSGVVADAPTNTAVPVGHTRSKSLRPFRVRPARTLKDEHERVLELVGENFCRVFAADISALMRAETTISMLPTAQWTWADLLAALPEAYCAARLNMPPMAGFGLQTVSMPLAVAMIERLLGGSGQGQTRSQPLTEVETALLADVHQRAAGDLAEAFAIVVQTQPETFRQESRLELIRAVAGRSLLIALEFEVNMGSAQGELRIAIPAESLLAKLEAFAGTTPRDHEVLGSTDRLLDCVTEVAIRFADTTLTSSEILSLSPGDIVSLGHPVTRPLTLMVDSTPYMSVVAGRRGHQKAFAVVESEPGVLN